MSNPVYLLNEAEIQHAVNASTQTIGTGWFVIVMGFLMLLFIIKTNFFPKDIIDKMYPLPIGAYFVCLGFVIMGSVLLYIGHCEKQNPEKEAIICHGIPINQIGIYEIKNGKPVKLKSITSEEIIESISKKENK